MARDIPVEQEVVELLHAINHHVRAASAQRLGPLGLTPAQARALRTIQRADGPVRMAHLAERLRIARRSATSVVDELVQQGLVERSDDPCDRRGVMVALTRKGVALLAKVDALRSDTAAELVGKLPRGQRTQLRDLLLAISPGEGGA